MRIAYLCNRYPAVSHTFIQREVEGLRQLGLSVDTFSIRRAHRADLLSDADVTADATTYAVLPPRPLDLLRAHSLAIVTRLPRYLATLLLALRLSPPGPRGMLWQFFYFGESMVIWHKCKRRGIAHIHAHFANVATDVALLATYFGTTRRCRWTWSFSLHGSAEFFEISRHRLGEKIRRALFVVCVSDFSRSQAMAFCEESEWEKLHLVHCGVDLAAFAPAPERDSDAPAGVGAAVEILSVGRLIGVKGQALMLDAFAALLRRGIDARLTLIGDGPKRAVLERRAAELGVDASVELAGAVAQDRVGGYYARSDIFCLSSFAEGLPVVLIEAMAMELPVVSTWITGIPELVEDGVSGLLVRPARADQLADALERLARDADLRRSMGRAGRARVAAEFASSDSAHQLREIFMASVTGSAAAEQRTSGDPATVPGS